MSHALTHVTRSTCTPSSLSSPILASRLAVTFLTHCEDPLPPQERGSSPELPPTIHLEEASYHQGWASFWVRMLSLSDILANDVGGCDGSCERRAPAGKKLSLRRGTGCRPSQLHAADRPDPQHTHTIRLKMSSPRQLGSRAAGHVASITLSGPLCGATTCSCYKRGGVSSIKTTVVPRYDARALMADGNHLSSICVISVASLNRVAVNGGDTRASHWL